MSKKLYLTFDDGPVPEVTGIVLEILKEYGFLATFFCLGKNVEAYPGMFSEIKLAGHAVGNHTFSHLNGWKTKNKEYYNDIEKAGKLIDSKLFRPPYGKISPLQWLHLRKKYRLMFWTFQCSDFRACINKEILLKKLQFASHPGAVILFHDTPKSWEVLKDILPRYLEYLKKQNYQCQVL